jgi:SAM-dependent methyltransferase
MMVSRDAADVNRGNVLGNHYDKYGTKNPIARALMRGFLGAVGELFGGERPANVLEVGCGEGRLADHLVRNVFRPERFDACDLSLAALAPDVDPMIRFFEGSIYELPYEAHQFDLVVCCEVLEHLAEPERGLAEVLRVSRRRVLLSTPREPIWRGLNLARLKYVSDWGNTPGHVQHWGRRELVSFVERQASVETVRTPLPWTILLAQKRG